MELNKYLDLVAETTSKMKFYRYLFRFMLAFCLLLIFLLVWSIRNEKLVLVPLNLPGPVTVRGNDADPDYLKSFVYYVSSLLLNYSSTSAAKQFDLFLQLVDPSSSVSLKKQLLEDLKNIQTGDMSSFFILSDVKVDSKNKIIVFSGTQTVWSSGHQISSSQTRYYYLKYKIDQGTVRILDFKTCNSVDCKDILS